MAQKNLSYTETAKILGKELNMLGTAFLWVYAHYALKRAFFFSILKCPNYFNIPFKRKDVNPLYSIRWGNGIKVVYPGIKLMMKAYNKEMIRHPFFRTLTTRKIFKKVSYEKTFPKMNKVLNLNNVATRDNKKINKKKKEFININKKMARRKNIWAKTTGAAYLSHRPLLMFKKGIIKKSIRIKPFIALLVSRSKKLRNRW
jgi:hypothetical protein